MESIKTLVDLGCGSGEDLIWWATATTRDDSPQPLNIRCVGVDLLDQLPIAKKYDNISYQPTDFETVVHAPKEKFDVLWCHDAFQYCIDPLTTLAKWREIASDGAMLVLSVPQTVQFSKNQANFSLPSGSFYHHSLVSLIYMLSVTGWDCCNGFFQCQSSEPWIRAVVYNSKESAKDPKKTTWYDLLETDLLPDSAKKSIQAHGYLRHQDLVVPWLDHNLTWLGKQ
jgi:SAM-dependent methyltransferase